METLAPVDGAGASVPLICSDQEKLTLKGVFKFECHDADGNLRWKDEVRNTVVTVGKNDMLDKYLAGSSYTAAFYLGLISSTSYSAIAAGDTMSSHAGWFEAGNANTPAYSQSTRPAPTFAAASAGSKATSASVTFSITSNGTAKGSFLTTVSTKDGTTGILFSAGLFTQGDRAVITGDTLSGTYTLTI